MEEIRNTRAEKVVLSSEYLFSPAFDTESLVKIKEHLSCCTTKILVVLRSQDNYLESSFSQRVIGPRRYSGSPRSHLRTLEKHGLFQYHNRLAVFDSVFGKKSVFVCWYEELCGDVTAPLRSLLEISEDFPLVANKVNGATNVEVFSSAMLDEN